MSLVHVDAPGAEPVAADLPDGASGAYPDGAGGFITGGGGGIYHVGPGGQPVRFATGDLLGASGSHALGRSCDEALRCRYVVIELDSGDIRPGPSTSGGEGRPNAVLSPDGSWILELDALAAVIDSPSGRLVVRSVLGDRVDLGTGAFACTAPGCLAVPQWAPTGGWLLWTVDPTTIGAWRPGLDGPRRVAMPNALVARDNPLSIQSLSVDTAEHLAAFVAQASVR